jgi:hypothetical protein
MYAAEQERPGMNRWRSVCAMASRTLSEMLRREVARAGASLPEITLGGPNRAAAIILLDKWQI